MKRYRALVLIVGLVFSVTAFAADAGIQWLSLKTGMEKAKQENRPLIVDFYYGKGCSRCEAMQKEVYGNPSIAAKVMKDFIPVRIDLKKKLTKQEEDLGKKYHFNNDCLLLFLDPNGEIIKDTMGKRLCFINKINPQWFIDYLNMVESYYRR
ncbi:MAG: thioredoxin family protein [Candidatus Sulfobium sp.]